MKPTIEELTEWMWEHNVWAFYEPSTIGAWRVDNTIISFTERTLSRACHALAKAKGLPWKWEEPG